MGIHDRVDTTTEYYSYYSLQRTQHSTQCLAEDATCASVRAAAETAARVRPVDVERPWPRSARAQRAPVKVAVETAVRARPVAVGRRKCHRLKPCDECSQLQHKTASGRSPSVAHRRQSETILTLVDNRKENRRVCIIWW